MNRERVYKILSCLACIVFAVGGSAVVSAVVVFALCFALIFLFPIRDSFAFALFLCGWVCALFFLSRWTLRLVRSASKEPPERKPSRFQSLALWGIVSLLGMILSLYLGWVWESEALNLVFLVFPVIGLVLALWKPFREHRAELPVQLLACGGMFWALMLFGFILSRMGKPLEYQGDNAQEIPHLSNWQKTAYFPKNASNISVHGSTIGFQWECTVPEADFLEFAKQWEFEKVTEPRTGDSMQPPYYFYERRAGNGGGVTLQYSPAEQKMTGFYSHH